MTEQTNAELIAEANNLLAENQWTSGWGVESLAERLADALEAAEQRATEYAAVIEKAEDYVTRHYLDTRFGDEVLPMLATDPADVLREHDAKVRAETLRDAASRADEWEAAEGMHGGEWFPSEWAGQVAGWLEHRADQIESEAGLK